MSYYKQSSTGPYSRSTNNQAFYSQQQQPRSQQQSSDDDWFTSTTNTYNADSNGINTNAGNSNNPNSMMMGMSSNSSMSSQQPSFGSQGGISIMNPNQMNSGSNNNAAAGFSGSINGGGVSSQQNISSGNLGDAFSGNMQRASSQNNSSMSSSLDTYVYDPSEFDGEPPLMEELGINITHITDKTQAVLLPFSAHAKSNASLMESDDLAGPLVIGLLLGGTLLLSGKLHFGYIYGFGMCSCVGMSLILNLMSPKGAISMWRIVSVLGYGLLPVNVLAALNLFLGLKNRGIIGTVLASLTIFWCTSASTRLFERSCDMRDQRYLIAYPTALVYCCFVIITVF